MGFVKMPLEGWLPNNQYGFQSRQQAAEVIFSVVLTWAKCLEWTHSFGVAKLDVSKAFDRLWGVAKGSSVSWVAKFKGDKNAECKLSNGWS